MREVATRARSASQAPPRVSDRRLGLKGLIKHRVKVTDRVLVSDRRIDCAAVNEEIERVSSTQGEEQDEEAAEAAARAVMDAMEMARGKGLLPSPTELHLDTAKPCATLPPLRWHHWGHQPYKMRLTNTGCTVMVSAKWRAKVRAHLTGGPLLGRYVFSQLHFHWGQQDTEGSEHTLQGDSFPLEMHMVLFKSRYLTQEAALKEMDGVVEVAYFFQLAKKDNPHLEPMIQALPKVACAMKSTRFGPLPLAELVPSFPTDYLLYMGSLLTGKCAHALTWIVRYQPLSISKRQVS
ncbi:carbonic anhydrase 2-like [Schistocerca cancellata]|uniref:carbonic anhydrase 2-like n=1 Tax=Schistocerca cancellata TaxID=274614 RepID=UPI00211778ED|nr:carbonic anhydrase 2-like [Schistocerca cancellata]